MIRTQFHHGKRTTLRDLLVEQLKAAYSAESQLWRLLPKISRLTLPHHLRLVLLANRERLRTQVSRLEEALGILGQKPPGGRSAAIDSLVGENGVLWDGAGEPAAVVAALVAFCHKAEHYSIASYASMAAWAEALRLKEVAYLLRETLAEKEQAEKCLRNLAETEFDLGMNGGSAWGAVPTQPANSGEMCQKGLLGRRFLRDPFKSFAPCRWVADSDFPEKPPSGAKQRTNRRNGL